MIKNSANELCGTCYSAKIFQLRACKACNMSPQTETDDMGDWIDVGFEVTAQALNEKG